MIQLDMALFIGLACLGLFALMTYFKWWIQNPTPTTNSLKGVNIRETGAEGTNTVETPLAAPSKEVRSSASEPTEEEINEQP